MKKSKLSFQLRISGRCHLNPYLRGLSGTFWGRRGALFVDKNPKQSAAFDFLDFMKNFYLGKSWSVMMTRHLWNKNPQLLMWIFVHK